ncbi:molybdopterin-dependent oxidoreductase [Patescibacteria group bacterium]|nr:molybdopterin-dependent oxidoreductase [Patescibacteria group bacterium]
MESSRFREKVAARDAWNSQHRYKKRGIAIVPSKFGLAFTFTTLNQGAALVHIYLDGSVSISHVRLVFPKRM